MPATIIIDGSVFKLAANGALTYRVDYFDLDFNCISLDKESGTWSAYQEGVRYYVKGYATPELAMAASVRLYRKTYWSKR